MRKPASVYARIVWIGATSLILSGCLTPTTWQPEVDSDRYAEEARKQSSIALQAILEDQTRVQRVAFPLLEAAATVLVFTLSIVIHFQNVSWQRLPKFTVWVNAFR